MHDLGAAVLTKMLPLRRRAACAHRRRQRL